MNYYISAGGFPSIKHMNLCGGLLLKHDVCKDKENNSEEDIIMAVVSKEIFDNANTDFISDMIYDVFSDWYDTAMEYLLDNFNFSFISDFWKKLLIEINKAVRAEYKCGKEAMGATFTGIFILGDKYMIVNVGDGQVFHVNDDCIALNKPQREWCPADYEEPLYIGREDEIRPDVIYGTVEEGLYVLSTAGVVNREENHEELVKLYYKSESGYDEVMRDIIDDAEGYIIENGGSNSDNIIVFIKAVRCMQESEGYLS